MEKPVRYCLSTSLEEEIRNQLNFKWKNVETVLCTIKLNTYKIQNMIIEKIQNTNKNNLKDYKKTKYKKCFTLDCQEILKNLRYIPPPLSSYLLTTNLLRGQYFQLKRWCRKIWRGQKEKLSKNALASWKSIYTFNDYRFWNFLKRQMQLFGTNWYICKLATNLKSINYYENLLKNQNAQTRKSLTLMIRSTMMKQH